MSDKKEGFKPLSIVRRSGGVAKEREEPARTQRPRTNYFGRPPVARNEDPDFLAGIAEEFMLEKVDVPWEVFCKSIVEEDVAEESASESEDEVFSPVEEEEAKEEEESEDEIFEDVEDVKVVEVTEVAAIPEERSVFEECDLAFPMVSGVKVLEKHLKDAKKIAEVEKDERPFVMCPLCEIHVNRKWLQTHYIYEHSPHAEHRKSLAENAPKSTHNHLGRVYTEHSGEKRLAELDADCRVLEDAVKKDFPDVLLFRCGDFPERLMMSTSVVTIMCEDAKGLQAEMIAGCIERTLEVKCKVSRSGQSWVVRGKLKTTDVPFEIVELRDKSCLAFTRMTGDYLGTTIQNVRAALAYILEWSRRADLFSHVNKSILREGMITLFFFFCQFVLDQPQLPPFMNETMKGGKKLKGPMLLAKIVSGSDYKSWIYPNKFRCQLMAVNDIVWMFFHFFALEFDFRAQIIDLKQPSGTLDPNDPKALKLKQHGANANILDVFTDCNLLPGDGESVPYLIHSFQAAVYNFSRSKTMQEFFSRSEATKLPETFARKI